MEVEYQRPAQFARDQTATVETLKNDLQWIENHRDSLPEHIVLLQPTCPLRNERNIDEAIKQYYETEFESLVSVHEMFESPFECVKVQPEGDSWEFVETPPHDVHRRQDYLEDFYYINGAIYIFSLEFLKEEEKLFEEGKAGLYIMSPLKGIDIDNPDDLDLARYYYAQMSDKN